MLTGRSASWRVWSMSATGCIGSMHFLTMDFMSKIFHVWDETCPRQSSSTILPKITSSSPTTAFLLRLGFRLRMTLVCLTWLLFCLRSVRLKYLTSVRCSKSFKNQVIKFCIQSRMEWKKRKLSLYKFRKPKLLYDQAPSTGTALKKHPLRTLTRTNRRRWAC